jgi:hypothetical protein
VTSWASRGDDDFLPEYGLTLDKACTFGRREIG